jgi:hypothetical protein
MPGYLFNFSTGTVKCSCLLTLLLLSQVTLGSGADKLISKHIYQYDASIGYLDAGVLTFQLIEFAHKYEILGRFESSRALSKYYTWTGVFASTGRRQGDVRQTDGYFVRSEGSDDHYKMVVLSKKEARLIEGRDQEFETLERPLGVDIISGLFFSSGCYENQYLHDGEDFYSIKVIKNRRLELDQKDPYVSGEGIECVYRVSDRRKRKRKIFVTLVDQEKVVLAAKIRVAVSFFPDPTFRLREK